ncbi:MAG: Crp/Fnr family transcriptional regulator [Piscinibacter sp.]|jgi:CRP/FNR family cyclic AMP-dependent transcriptional regulator|uniref:Crp/Fnr family transcriptional regulator n=1 Tax=Piscinibacter sp. TaxID=1903157 RepID=UPI003378FF91|nr:Crp/Fnr family transcriptional regulator [Rhodoferax sp.]
MPPTEPRHSQPADLAVFLERWPWYRALPVELRSLMLETTTERTAEAGEYIARAGEPCLHWYGLSRGFLQMYVLAADGSETTLYCLREGEWGGDGSLLKKELRRYDLRALTPSHIFLVPATTFETLRQSSIPFNHFLCEILNERMGTFVGMLEASRLLGPEMRVARGLLMLANSVSSDAQELSIPQHELALICGLSRQRVNMALSEFRRVGFVRNDPHKGILLVDVPRLRAYVVSGDGSTQEHDRHAG